MTKYRYFNDSLLLQIYALYKGDDVLRLDAECAEGNNPHPKNLIQGSIYLSVGSFFITLYAFCLIAMAQEKFMKIICYRILFVVGFVDIFSLVPSSILPGYFLVMGYSFCDSPLLNLWIATLCFADWCVYCALSVVLGVNRCVDFIGPQLQQIAIQCFGICTTVMITGIFYCTICSGFIVLPPIMYLVTNGSWQFSNSSMAIFYMVVNKSMRREVLKLIYRITPLGRIQRYKVTSSSNQTA
ncbi:unnamed protein product, partial [Mesorhabditis belari]|uniref:G protein-coupled receptor n=1 Tax=Mesorhabditis belari TaxID=2138241 RepID=A0AAF3EQI2_9BILA